MNSRPLGAPEPTQEVKSFIAESRKGARAAQRLRRSVTAALFTMLLSISLGLIVWINQDYVKTQWRWYAVTLPYARTQVWPYVLSTAKEQALKQGDSFKECAQDCPEMIVIPAGSFRMGRELTPSTDSGAPTDYESPAHTVELATPFAGSKYEVTFADWDACVRGGGCNGYEPNDMRWGRGRQPVINVSWDDAQRYVVWVSEVTGKTYRLLSEAEYEYAADADWRRESVGGNNANCDGCGSKWDHKQPAPVGSFPPSRFGLYDMVGNTWEWVEDCLHDTYEGAPTDGSAWIEGGNCSNHVVRGGSYDTNVPIPLSMVRLWNPTGTRSAHLGFRLGRTLLTQ